MGFNNVTSLIYNKKDYKLLLPKIHVNYCYNFKWFLSIDLSYSIIDD